MSAIAVHNIPEGLAIAVPVLASTGNRWKAIWMTLASGMSEPLGTHDILLSSCIVYAETVSIYDWCITVSRSGRRAARTSTHNDRGNIRKHALFSGRFEH